MTVFFPIEAVSQSFFSSFPKRNIGSSPPPDKWYDPPLFFVTTYTAAAFVLSQFQGTPFSYGSFPSLFFFFVRLSHEDEHPFEIRFTSSFWCGRSPKTRLYFSGIFFSRLMTSSPQTRSHCKGKVLFLGRCVNSFVRVTRNFVDLHLIHLLLIPFVYPLLSFFQGLNLIVVC